VNAINQPSHRLEVAGIVLVALGLRPALVSIGPTIVTIQDYFGMSHFAAGALVSIPDLLMGILALPTPWLVKKLGRDNLIIGALLLLAVSTLARAIAPGVVSLLLSTAGVGAGIAVAGTLLSGFVKATFPAKAAFMMGIYATSLSLGSTLAAVSTAPVLEAAHSWRVATGMWALPAMAGVVAWLLVAAKEKKALKGLHVPQKIEIPWKDGLAWRIALFFAGVNLIFYALVAWTAPMFIEYGLPVGAAGFILGCFTFFFTLSSLFFGTVSKSVDRRIWLIVSSQIALVGLVLMYIFPGALPFVFIAVVAVGLGGSFTLSMTLPLDNTNNPQETNAWTAFVLTVGYLIAAVGPLLLGAIRDLTGDFQASLLTLIGFAAIMTLIGGSLKPRKRKLQETVSQ